MVGFPFQPRKVTLTFSRGSEHGQSSCPAAADHSRLWFLRLTLGRTGSSTQRTTSIRLALGRRSGAASRCRDQFLQIRLFRSGKTRHVIIWLQHLRRHHMALSSDTTLPCAVVNGSWVGDKSPTSVVNGSLEGNVDLGLINPWLINRVVSPFSGNSSLLD